jgi:hypothetical protein
MNLKPGLRLKSQVSETEIVVVKGTGDHELACGGVPLVALDEPVADGAATAPDQTGSTLLGKRYTDAADSVEVLCARDQVGQGPPGLGLSRPPGLGLSRPCGLGVSRGRGWQSIEWFVQPSCDHLVAG